MRRKLQVSSSSRREHRGGSCVRRWHSARWQCSFCCKPEFWQACAARGPVLPAWNYSRSRDSLVECVESTHSVFCSTTPCVVWPNGIARQGRRPPISPDAGRTLESTQWSTQICTQKHQPRKGSIYRNNKNKKIKWKNRLAAEHHWRSAPNDYGRRGEEDAEGQCARLHTEAIKRRACNGESQCGQHHRELFGMDIVCARISWPIFGPACQWYGRYLERSMVWTPY